MQNIKKLLGSRIKEIRKSKGWTQEELAEILGIDQRTISAIERGANFPTKNFIKIAEVFHIELKELFDFEHLELNSNTKKQKIQQMLEKLDSRDTDIIYRIIKSMI